VWVTQAGQKAEPDVVSSSHFPSAGSRQRRLF
jgi:hypothetical protein